jgi:hypothetical protein
VKAYSLSSHISVEHILIFVLQTRTPFYEKRFPLQKVQAPPDDELNKMQTAFREIFNIPAFPGTE